MKLLLILLVIAFTAPFNLTAQNCDNIKVNLKKGTINKLKLTADQAKIKKQLPCFTGDTEDGSDYNCGGGVFYLDHGFCFYSGENYFEIRKQYKGTTSVPVLGLQKDQAIKNLKMGKPVRSEMNGDTEYLFFKTSYGCLWLKINEDIVTQIDLSANSAKDVILCL